MGASTTIFSTAFLALCLSATTNAYWLMGANPITKERIDPIVNPGKVSGHTHIVFGGSNFGLTASTENMRKSECSSVPVKEDKSNYWAPLLYFQWANGSFSSLDGGSVIYYLFNDKAGTTTAFPPDFRMLSGDPTLRSYNATSHAQLAIDFLCLDFNGQTTKHTGLPEKQCPSGIRSQVNFPSCWDGKNVDSPDHKSHVAFRSGGPDSGDCLDPKYPVNLPRIFMELYWNTGEFDNVRSQAMNPNQPFVFAYGDPTGYGNHADFYNGWEDGVLQRAVDNCNCNPYGDPTCCGDKGIFTLLKDHQCHITPGLDERTTGMLPKLPGNNPVQPAGQRATMYSDPVSPARILPVFAYTGDSPTATGTVVGGPTTASPTGGSSSTATTTSSSSAATTTTTSSSATATSTTSSSSGSVSTTSSSSVSIPAVVGTSSTTTTSTSTGKPTATVTTIDKPTKPAATVTGTTSTTSSSSASGTTKPTSTTSTTKATVTATTSSSAGASKPTSSHVCGKPKSHHHGKRHFSRNHQRRYDFDADA
ncbi:hypothetical protein DFP72DRAFT_884346 [Ephemerocybe angulata]|uniref:DUF1996 domain-containing protein n=1 Tax=Ephemerocybe angulata TaxID=980116 RepID=A0A8H6I766_9AGAR|nr:hypothetical protein DFP72DRAFT_884346 [Tulosesus angulatus]